MQAENPGASVDVEVLAAVPSFEAEDGSRTVELAVALGATEAAERVTYGTEAGQFAGTGIDTIVCGPGDIAQAHGPNEYVDLAQLLACEAFVDRLIEHLRAGD